MRLSDIIKNGSLLDNQYYLVNEGILTNRWLSESVTLSNDESSVWDFLISVSRDIEKELKEINIDNALILFNDKEYEHNAYDSFFRVTGTDHRNFTLNTGNLIGYVKRGDYSLKISSRFGDAFLQYIISDADGFLELEHFGDVNYAADEGYEWLLAYIWNIKFKKAYRLGLPKTYITKHDRISRVRGTIDVIDYFKNNVSGKYLCSYREHSYDTPATALFIKAYETIGHHPFCQRTRNIYNVFLTANQGMKRSLKEILKTPHFTNPFYNDYNVLIDLSKRVINQKGSHFGSQDDSSAFFFDISMLFEYFIRKLIKRCGFRLHSKDGRHKIPAGSLDRYKYKRKLEPDLVFESAGGLYIFDVKYKYFDPKYGVSREDLFQLHTYIGQYGNEAPVKGCGFIYPIPEEIGIKVSLNETQGLISDVIHQQGKDIPFHVLFLIIPDNKSPDFNKLMSNQCRIFIEALKGVIINTR